MKKAGIWLAVVALFAGVALQGCGGSGAESSPIPWACPCTVQWNGEYYCFWAGLVEDTSTVGSVVGEVQSIVEISTMPEEDGQANFPGYYETSILGAPIAECGEGIAIFVDEDDVWLWLPPYEAE